MDSLIVRGGQPLSGEVKISGSKNTALPLMAACMLARGESVISNVPELRDIETMGQVLEHLGVRVRREEDRLYIDATNLERAEAPYDMVRKMRASIYVMGPMLARLHYARVSLPGGCAIGPRPIDLHLKGFQSLGAKVTMEHGYVVAEGERMHGAEFSLEGEFGSSVGATCNVLMAAALTPGRTVIRGAAKEPDVVEVGRMLGKMGARISTTNGTITIDGVDELQPTQYSVIPDRIEAGTYLVAGAITQGDVLAVDARPEHLKAVLEKLQEVGAKIEITDRGVRVQGRRPIQPVSIRTLPYPGFPTDMQAQFMALLCLAEGESSIQEGIYPDRFIHVAELLRMGADIQHSGSKARIKGVPKLQGAPLMASDLRASAALVLAALAAEGESEILRVYHIDRGYERIEEKLGALGADVFRKAKTPATGAGGF